MKEKELKENSVVKNFFTTAADGKEYNVTFYTLDMILAVGFRVRSKRGTYEAKQADKEDLEELKRLKNKINRVDG